MSDGFNNSKIELFNKIASRAKTQDMSVIKNYFDQQNTVASYYSSGHPLNLTGNDRIKVQNTINSKPMRIADYRRISNYNEVGDAIDEIADAHMTQNQDGKFVKVEVVGKTLMDTMLKEIEDEANHFFGLFNFEDNIFEYARKLTIEGELCWENIVDADDKEKGVIDVRYIPNETFEFAYDTKAREKTGIAVLSDTPASDPSVLETKKDAGFGYNSVNVTKTLSCYSQLSAGKVVYLPFSQITYINSGIYDGTGLVVYPALERARRAYNQLQLIEDAVVVYRLVRAPVRNVFTVDCGKMPPAKAEQHVRNIAQKFTSKKQYDPATGSISGTYDPVSILENVWIPKSSDSGGVNISSIGGEAKWGDLDDLNYFLRKLYRALKVPASRFISGTTGEPVDRTYQHTDEITYEEYRFAKYINRSLTCFARGLKESLITHLKLTGTWERANLRPQNIKVTIAPPIEIEIYRNQKLMENKISNYSSFVEAKGISVEYAQEKILGMSKQEIDSNREKFNQEQIDSALFTHKLKDIEENGITEQPKNIDGVDESENHNKIPSDIESEVQTEEESEDTENEEEVKNPDLGDLGNF